MGIEEKPIIELVDAIFTPENLPVDLTVEDSKARRPWLTKKGSQVEAPRPSEGGGTEKQRPTMGE